MSVASPNMENLELVRLTEADLSGIMALEKSCYPQPWTVDNFLGELQRRITLAIGIKDNGKLAAQCFFWIIPPEIHLLNLAVLPEYRRRGLARRLTSAMISIGRRAKIESVYLEARRGNTAAVILYESLGFVVSGRRPGYYEDGEEALLMTLDLTNICNMTEQR